MVHGRTPQTIMLPPLLKITISPEKESLNHFLALQDVRRQETRNSSTSTDNTNFNSPLFVRQHESQQHQHSTTTSNKYLTKIILPIMRFEEEEEEEEDKLFFSSSSTHVAVLHSIVLLVVVYCSTLFKTDYSSSHNVIPLVAVADSSA